MIFCMSCSLVSAHLTLLTLALLIFRITFKKNQDKGQYTGMVILDLQKAFDTVNHKILISKLRAMGVGQAALKWFDSYLGGRKQTVAIPGVFSEFRTVTCGVPQGSILGPLLFLIYVNDMKAAVKCKLLLYADDSALLASSRYVSEIEIFFTLGYDFFVWAEYVSISL